MKRRITLGFKDECGIFGIWGDHEASKWTYLGLYALQHRGQETCGIVTLDLQKKIQFQSRRLGLVADAFNRKELDRLKGDIAIGHVRYSITGRNSLNNIQPLTTQWSQGQISIAHNGNIVNATEIRKKLSDTGTLFHGTNDTEIILHLLAKQPELPLLERLKHVLGQLDGAFSLLILTNKSLIVVRDTHGFRPLILGKKGKGTTVIASESCALDLIEADYIREIEPGEIFWRDKKGEHSDFFTKSIPLPNKKKSKLSKCIFEHVYFSRPDSFIFGESVYQARKTLGERLAKKDPIKADMVIPVPDSGIPAAIGYSEASKIPFQLGIIRNHYVGRTFIEPTQSMRNFGVKIKLNPLSTFLKGKHIIVVDDSLVRGTTSKKVVQILRKAGVEKIHFRIAAPPTRGSCFYGVDTPKAEKLIMNTLSLEEVRKSIGADSLAYLSMEDLFAAVKDDKSTYCAACFDKKYPTFLYDNPIQ